MKVSESSTEYEKLTQHIYKEILALDGVENIDVRHNVQITGKSGVAHQIDVYWEYKYAGISHKVLIECKHYNHNVSLLYARNMHGLLTDVPNSSGVLVTTFGYQSGVEKYADFYGIALKLLRPPKTEDWDGGIQIINIDMKLLRNTYVDLKCDYDGNDAITRQLTEDNPSLMKSSSDSMMILEDGYELSTLVAWLDRHTPRETQEFGVELEHTIYPQDSYYVAPGGEKLKLGRVYVRYVTSCMEQNLHIDHMSLVQAVLEDFNSKEVEHMSRKT
ncbi:restriction endonuclease [Shewanella mangrovisoli]|uniref:restriction endonuclease n=1 Tax=Shewanella mangrovisoli TaxID=2864211 RepID=UPI00313C31AC